MDLWSVDWARLFVPSGSLVEIVIRGTFLYIGLLAMLRLMPRREVGSVGVSDLLVLVLLADAAQNAMAGDYDSITEGVVLVATILFWAYFVDWLDHRFPQWHLKARGPLTVVRHGRLLKRNMDREKITEEELMSQLRQHGIEDLSGVKRAYVEGDGRISIIKFSEDDQRPDDRRVP
jgi:uncharacterized membrane protein YcaP (DUF421 family)